VGLPSEFVVVRERARPLAPDDRREMILGAILPLLRERGRDVTSRELAEAAGIAEGTLFRAFGDKESIIQAGVEKLLDPQPFRDALRTIDPRLPLEDKLVEIIELLRERFRGVFTIMAAFEMTGRPPMASPGGGEEWIAIVKDLLAADADRLVVPVETVAYYLRLVAFSASLPPLNQNRTFDAAELATLITHGIAAPAPVVPPFTPQRRAGSPPVVPPSTPSRRGAGPRQSAA
jgi:AcrR family transcriptional regulator